MLLTATVLLYLYMFSYFHVSLFIYLFFLVKYTFENGKVAYAASFQVGQNDLSEMMREISSIDCTIIVAFINYDDCPKFYQEIKRYIF